MKVNKKGQEMSVATLVLIVIGIVVLVMLILGFTLGWQNLWNKINILGGASDVSTVIQACNLAATTDDQNAYCNEFKSVKIGNQKQYVNCQNVNVQPNLDKTLDCGGKSAEENAREYCAQLYSVELVENVDKCPIAVNVITMADRDKIIADVALYNGESCLTLLTRNSVRTDAAACIILKTA